MKWIKDRVRAGEVLSGVWLVLGSPIVTEIAGNAGYDWAVIDLEHGMAGDGALLAQIQALEGTPAAPLVRVQTNDANAIKRALDVGAVGIVVPQVSSADEAEAAVRAMRYPPEGIRGVTAASRPTGFGIDFHEYYSTANDNVLCVVQIESRAGLAAVEEIAAVDGVDVIFVGPNDLSASMGIIGRFDDPEYLGAILKIVAAAKDNGKAVGILVKDRRQVASALEDGFTFVGAGSDGGVLAKGLDEIAGAFKKA
jgi:4-hydroxy-2-oxoheptanedioate aldolase